MEKKLTVNGKTFRILSLLGSGKGGFSYLAENDGRFFTLKQIHHIPCEYYSFGNKIESEARDYKRLKNAGIRVPELYDIDMEQERLVKEYIDGPTVFDLIEKRMPVDPYLAEVRAMAKLAENAGLNIDYFPTNFIAQRGVLYYIDYECNEYMQEWSFESWGIRYWSRTPEFEAYLAGRKEKQ
ncbi:MAG: hypothetical protein IKE16_05540 [Solobacterium sp.]|nr:hypothetical protein [Solobacterium sp.]